MREGQRKIEEGCRQTERGGGGAERQRGKEIDIERETQRDLTILWGALSTFLISPRQASRRCNVV